MTLADTSTGPYFVIWIVFAVFAVMSIVLLSGHGSWMIAGYNTASKEEKAKYNEKKMCRIVGAGMAVIALLLLVMGLFGNVLPASFSWIFFGAAIVDVIVLLVLLNTVCRKK